MTTITATIRQDVERMASEGASLKKVRGYLDFNDVPPKDAKDLLDEMGLTNARPKGFANSYYDWLAEADRTEKEAVDYIMGEGEYGETTANIIKHRSHYMNIYHLTARIRRDLGQGMGEAKEVKKPRGRTVKAADK